MSFILGGKRNLIELADPGWAEQEREGGTGNGKASRHKHNFSRIPNRSFIGEWVVAKCVDFTLLGKSVLGGCSRSGRMKREGKDETESGEGIILRGI